MDQKQKKSEIIEKTGLLFEQFGMTRMSGRILGYLMVNDEPQVSFDEFTRELGASKSTISTNLRVLLQMVYIRQVTLHGDRKTYYTLNNELSWTDNIKARSGTIVVFLNLFSQALEVRSDPRDNSSVWLKKAHLFYEFSERMVPIIIDEWRKFELDSQQT